MEEFSTKFHYFNFIKITLILTSLIKRRLEEGGKSKLKTSPQSDYILLTKSKIFCQEKINKSPISSFESIIVAFTIIETERFAGKEVTWRITYRFWWNILHIDCIHFERIGLKKKEFVDGLHSSIDYKAVAQQRTDQSSNLVRQSNRFFSLLQQNGVQVVFICHYLYNRGRADCGV